MVWPFSRISAPWPPNGGQLQRRKQEIEIGDRAAADQCQSAARQGGEFHKRRAEFVRNVNLERRWPQFDQCAVDIEQNSNAVGIGRGKSVDCRAVDEKLGLHMDINGRQRKIVPSRTRMT
jgi:hypothetical protein